MSAKSFVGLLSSLVTKGEFRKFHDELGYLLDQCHRNSCEDNSSFCCELIEHQARLQRHLFQLLKLSTDEENPHDNNSLQTKLLPWLCTGFVSTGDNGEEMASLREEYESRIEELKDELKNAEQEIISIQIKMQQATVESKNRNEELVKTQKKVVELKRENSYLYERLNKQLSKSESLTDLLSSSSGLPKTRDTEKQNGGTRNGLSLLPNRLSSGYNTTILQEKDRCDRLVKHFGELFNEDRAVLMKTLEGLNDRDTNENIIFKIVQECFFIARQEQQKMKTRMSQALQPSADDVMDELRVREIVDNFMKRNTENYDTETLLPDVFSSVRRQLSSSSVIISLNELLLNEFTRSVLTIVWSMVALNPPIVTASAQEGDIIRESRYRRSYKAEFSSTTIHHYIWPCLLRDGKILTKGEVVTRRTPTRNIRMSSKSPMRSRSTESFMTSSRLKGSRLDSSWDDYSFDKKLNLSWSGSV